MTMHNDVLALALVFVDVATATAAAVTVASIRQRLMTTRATQLL